jgi:hypothetical protein
MLSLYFFIKFKYKKEYIIPLLISSILLILSHHFTTYFYIISTSFILFSNLSDNLKEKNDFLSLIYITITSIFAFSYWGLIAQPVFNNFIKSKMFLDPYIIIILFYTILFGGFLLIKLLNFEFPKFNLFKGISNAKKFLLFVFIWLSISLLSINRYIPGVYVKITPLAFIYSLPMIFLISLSFTGFSELKKTHGGKILRGWIFAISLSFIYSIISSNLYPDRHLEYIIIPFCVPAAILIKNILSINKSLFRIKKNFSPLLKPILKITHTKTIMAIIISIMCISNMIAAYPTINALNHIDERVTKPCINAFDWMDGNISNNSVIASDHRLEMLLWAEGYNITFGNTNKTWTSNNTLFCFLELKKLNVSYILIDDIMKNSVVNVNVGEYFYMSNRSYNKFSTNPFKLVYRNATISNDNIELHWIELYKINYNFININL